MEHVLILNIVAILAVAALIGFFTDIGNRAVAFLTVLWALFCVSLLGWFIFAAVHFVGKYW